VITEYLTDLDTLICPSNAYAANAMECYDEGKTPSSLWTFIPGKSKDKQVEPCEINTEPYSYYGFAFSKDTFTAHDDFSNFDAALEHWDIGLEFAFVNDGPEGTIAYADKDWSLSNTPLRGGTQTTVYRLREGIERFLITDINNPAASARAESEIVVMHDSVSSAADHFNHVPGGANVLFMDGHVEFLKWSPTAEEDNPFPLNRAGIALHEAGETETL
jgi:prepilin-type processing-associated H-X9-DG protein